MCMGGGGSPKVEVPKPSPLPPPLPPPPPPKPVQQVAKKLEAPDAKPDIRIGASKAPSTSGRERRTSSSLSIGGGGTNNQGLNL